MGDGNGVDKDGFFGLNGTDAEKIAPNSMGKKPLGDYRSIPSSLPGLD